MEKGDENTLHFWTICKDVSLKEFAKLYDLLGVSFDFVQSESMYCHAAQKLIDMWKLAGLIKTDNLGRMGVSISIDSAQSSKFIPLTKSDGSTLYLTRDLAAIIDRHDQLLFDQIYYVVDNGQHQHFLSMKACLKAIQRPGLADELQHVKFGRVEGMSTRTGNVIFVDELIKEGQSRAVQMLKVGSASFN